MPRLNLGAILRRFNGSSHRIPRGAAAMCTAFSATALYFSSSDRSHCLDAAGQQELAHPTVSSPRLILAGDIGGTTSRLKMYQVSGDQPIEKWKTAPGKLIYEKQYLNIEYRSLLAVLQRFIKDAAVAAPATQTESIAVACLAVAGVVTDNVCRLTNVDWTVDGDEIEKALDADGVEIINDFVAQGYGILTLDPKDLNCLHDAPVNDRAPIACLGAGTGLGECFLTPGVNGEYSCFPSEGGHAEWAPRGQGSDDTQIDLLKWLKIKYSGWNRVSVERVASGPGIANIYEYLAWKNPELVDKTIHREFLNSHRSPKVIAIHARAGNLCEKALEMFLQCYGSEAGVVALKYMPFGGLYLTGGVTAKMLPRLMNTPEFMEAYKDKGRVSPLLSRVPLYVVPEGISMGERGSHLRAVQLLRGGRKCSDGAAAEKSKELVPPRHTKLADQINRSQERV